MKTFFLFIAFLLTTLGSKAHGVDISIMTLVQEEDNTWTLQVRSSLDAFRKEVKTHFAASPYKNPEEFKQQLLEHFRNTLKISVNSEQEVSLNHGVVKLGHETTVYFSQIALPKNLSSLKLVASMFKDIYRSKIKLLILKKGLEKQPFILDKNNNFTTDLIVQENKFVYNSQEESFFSSYWIFITSFLVIVFMVILLFRKKYSKQTIL